MILNLYLIMFFVNQILKHQYPLMILKLYP